MRLLTPFLAAALLSACASAPAHVRRRKTKTSSSMPRCCSCSRPCWS